VASTAGLGVLLQEGIGDTIRISLTPEPGGDRTRESSLPRSLLQTWVALVLADGDRLAGLRAHHQTYFQELAQRSKAYLREQMPSGVERYPGVEDMHVAVMGCVRQRPGEASAPVSYFSSRFGERPVAPVYWTA